MSLIPNPPEILLPRSCVVLNLERSEKHYTRASFDVSAGRFHASLVFLPLYNAADDVEYISDGHVRDEGCQRACNSAVAFCSTKENKKKSRR